MTRDEVLATLRAAEGELRAKGVKRAALFGSVARGEAGPDSDIDIMVELEPHRHVGVFGFVDIMHAIEDLFPAKVDVSEREALAAFRSAERRTRRDLCLLIVPKMRSTASG